MNVRNGACVVLAITSCAAGCATPAPASDSIRATTTLADVDGCNLLGKVIVADGPNAEKEARAETARLGGNVLLRKGDQVWNGNAYHCPTAAH
jgi:lipopolysaccharide export system protein LptA